ncbi:MAG: ring-hydroxylating dioxygenase ferredoxin reductase family protein [Comamonas sp.]|nr:ring-hydroxylating dioxygenase ferredoxin reductase family protein [Comamonas sp.]
MTYKIALNFEDGITRFIDCNASETVADAAYRQGVNVPIDCRDGACGACKCKAESGQYELGFYIDDAMSEEEASLGYVLTCQMQPQSDCVVNVPASSQACKIKQASINASVEAVHQLSPSTISLVLQGQGIDKLSFLPGQYANLQVPGTTQTRAYSFSAMPAQGKVSFLIRNLPGGLMSGYLTSQAKPGDSIQLTGPIGSFYLREVVRPVLMLAGGTGLAPFLAMLDKLAAQAGGANHPVHPIHLIYGVNTDADIVETERLDAFKAALPQFSYDICVVAEDSSHPKKGYVTHHLEPAHLHEGNVDIYLCGPPPMVEAVANHLRAQALEPASFHYEKFAASV